MKYSIIITAYNSERYITKCLDSLVNQTCKNFSVIVVDDGSTDSTKTKIDPYLEKLDIKYYYKKNSGVSDSRNFGIKKVNTPYFLFLDSDDLVSPNLIETIDKYTKYDVLSFQSVKVDENGNTINHLNKKTYDSTNGEQFLKALMKKKSYFFLAPWGYVFNSKFWKDNDFKFSKNYIMEDSGLIPLVLLRANNIISIDLYGYYYIQTNESIMRTNNDAKIKLKNESILYQYDNLMSELSKIKLDKNFKRIFDDYFAGWLLWYGTTLNKKYLPNYMKEIEKRNIYKKFKKNSIKVITKIIMCKINYNLYFKLYNFVHR